MTEPKHPHFMSGYILRLASRVKLRKPGCWHSHCVKAPGQVARQGLTRHRLQSGSTETALVFTCALSFTHTLQPSMTAASAPALHSLGWFGISWFMCAPVYPPPPQAEITDELADSRRKTGMSWHISLITKLRRPPPASLMIHRWREHK